MNDHDEAKKKQGYRIPKLGHCAACVSFRTNVWAGGKILWVYTCVLGGFKVERHGTCNNYKQSTVIE